MNSLHFPKDTLSQVCRHVGDRGENGSGDCILEETGVPFLRPKNRNIFVLKAKEKVLQPEKNVVIGKYYYFRIL
jgi:hypothetical protein